MLNVNCERSNIACNHRARDYWLPEGSIRKPDARITLYAMNLPVLLLRIDDGNITGVGGSSSFQQESAAREGRGAHKGRSTGQALLRAAALAFLAMLTISTSGCWMAAAELAPVAIQAVEAVGSGVANLAEGAAISAHQQNADKNTPPPDSDVCDELSLEVPMLVELRTDTSGTTRYRELSLGGADLEPEWEPMPNQDPKEGGWKLASNFEKMDFQPPIQNQLTANSVSYVAYAAADAHDATEQDQLNALEIGFGPAIGTFTWNQRSFRYALVHKLPCFPPPPEQTKS
jgi:hypothetical protein